MKEDGWCRAYALPDPANPPTETDADYVFLAWPTGLLTGTYLPTYIRIGNPLYGTISIH